MKRHKPTFEDAAAIAIRKFHAPSDLASYRWAEAQVHGETFESVTFTDIDASVQLEHSDVSTYGSLSVGWDVERRIAAFSWQPAEKD